MTVEDKKKKERIAQLVKGTDIDSEILNFAIWKRCGLDEIIFCLEHLEGRNELNESAFRYELDI